MVGDATLLRPALPVEPLEPNQLVVIVIDEGHELTEHPMTRLLRDQPVHRLTHLAILGVALRSRPQLEHVHGLAGVELHHVTDPVGEGDGIGRLTEAEALRQRRVEDRRPRHLRLVKLGIAIGALAEGAVRSNVRKARAVGVSDEDIRQAALLAISTAGFPTATSSCSRCGSASRRSGTTGSPTRSSG